MVRVGRYGNVLCRPDLVVEPLPRPRVGRQRAAAPTTAERRALENRSCIGGLRRPVASVRRLPYLASAGKRLRRAIEEAIDGQDGADLTQLFGLKPETVEGRRKFEEHERLKVRVRS